MSILDKLTGNLGTSNFQDVKGVFDSSGVPVWVWAPIMSMESGGNPNARAYTSLEDSRGLFQINVKAHPQWSNVNLFDPVENAKIADANFIAPAYKKAIDSGLTNKGDITAFVWKNGIRPAWNSQKETAIKSATGDIVQTGGMVPVSPGEGGLLGGVGAAIKHNPAGAKKGALWGAGGLELAKGATSFWEWFQIFWAWLVDNTVYLILILVGIIIAIAVLKSMFLGGGSTNV